jgi:hypothetical protein
LWDVGDPQCPDNRFTDGGGVVGRTHRPRSTLQKRYFSASGAHFCWRLGEPHDLVLPEGLGTLEKVR